MEKIIKNGVEWRHIDSIPGYEFSELGEIKSTPMRGNFWKGRILKTRTNRYGYEQVQLFVEKKSRTFLVHRLIAKAFIPNPDDKPQVNHRDGDKMNNSVENLEWVTPSENEQHKFKVLGYRSVGRKKASRPVLCVDTGEKYESFREAERLTGISHSAIMKVANGKTSVKNGYRYKNLTAGGYVWQSL